MFKMLEEYKFREGIGDSTKHNYVAFVLKKKKKKAVIRFFCTEKVSVKVYTLVIWNRRLVNKKKDSGIYCR